MSYSNHTNQAKYPSRGWGGGGGKYQMLSFLPSRKWKCPQPSTQKWQSSMLHTHSSKEAKEEELHKFACETKTYAERKK
jgi:hypothetical protein